MRFFQKKRVDASFESCVVDGTVTGGDRLCGEWIACRSPPSRFLFSKSLECAFIDYITRWQTDGHSHYLARQPIKEFFRYFEIIFRYGTWTLNCTGAGTTFPDVYHVKEGRGGAHFRLVHIMPLEKNSPGHWSRTAISHIAPNSQASNCWNGGARCLDNFDTQTPDCTHTIGHSAIYVLPLKIFSRRLG